jgi:hypothetical protein
MVELAASFSDRIFSRGCLETHFAITWSPDRGSACVDEDVLKSETDTAETAIARLETCS